jgi:hypothetical protein
MEFAAFSLLYPVTIVVSIYDGLHGPGVGKADALYSALYAQISILDFTSSIQGSSNKSMVLLLLLFVILRLAPGPFGPSMCFLSINVASHKFRTAQATNF